MLTNKVITIYHFNEQNDAYAPVWQGKAHVYLKRGISGSKSGIEPANTTVCRIATTGTLTAENGDYILIGKGGTEFDREKCLMITAISDNRRGSLPHWRLECE